ITTSAVWRGESTCAHPSSEARARLQVVDFLPDTWKGPSGGVLERGRVPPVARSISRGPDWCPGGRRMNLQAARGPRGAALLTGFSPFPEARFALGWRAGADDLAGAGRTSTGGGASKSVGSRTAAAPPFRPAARRSGVLPPRAEPPPRELPSRAASSPCEASFPWFRG